VQVAARFHLVRNLGEAIEPVLARHHACQRDDGDQTDAGIADAPTAAPTAPAVQPPQPTSRQQARHAAVQELVAHGLSHSQTARTLRLDRKTVRRYARAATVTEVTTPRQPRRSRLDPFTDYLAAVSENWKTNVGKSTSVNWPTGIGAKGNEGVAGEIKQNPYSIGYVEYAEEYFCEF